MHHFVKIEVIALSWWCVYSYKRKKVVRLLLQMVHLLLQTVRLVLQTRISGYKQPRWGVASVFRTY